MCVTPGMFVTPGVFVTPGMFVTLVLTSALAVLSSGASSQFKMNTASSNSTNGKQYVTCGSASNLLVRTAHYLATPPVSARHSQHCRGQGCPTSDILFRREELTSDDVVKIYRHCSRHAGSCDLSSAGVERGFEMSYYCLQESLINPCSNETYQPSGRHLTLLLNYSRHTTARDVTCQCDVTTTRTHTLNVRALNIMETPDVEGGTAQNVSSGPAEEEEGGRGLLGPTVMIDDPFNQWQWAVERGAWPVEWQWRVEGNTSLSVLFDQVQGVHFGHVWMDFQGEAMQVSCSFTAIPGDPEETPDESGPHVLPTQGRTGWLVMYVSVASSIVIILLVIVIVSVAKCRQRPSVIGKTPRPYDALADPSISSNNTHTTNNTTNNTNTTANAVALEGEYCTISEAMGGHSALPDGAPKSRDPGRPIRDETETETETSFSKGGHATHGDGDDCAAPPKPARYIWHLHHHISHPPPSHTHPSHLPLSHPPLSHPSPSHLPPSHHPLSHPSLSYPPPSHPPLSHPTRTDARPLRGTADTRRPSATLSVGSHSQSQSQSHSHSHSHSQSHSQHSIGPVPASDTYESLCHHHTGARRPSAPLAGREEEVVIYDHTDHLSAEGEVVYHRLQHCVRPQPRVIDNTYDVTSNVTRSGLPRV